MGICPKHEGEWRPCSACERESREARIAELEAEIERLRKYATPDIDEEAL